MGPPARPRGVRPFFPDAEQRRVLEHERGPLAVTGAAGTGKSAVLRERFARLLDRGANAERVALVVRTRRARDDARRELLERLRRALPGLRVVTIHGLAYQTLSTHYASLGYERVPNVLTAFDQFATVRDLLAGEDPVEWPTLGAMLRLRGFADQVRQFLLRAQEALRAPEDVLAASEAGTAGWRELARFYRRYLDVLDALEAVDFAGLVVRAAAALQRPDGVDPPFDHVLVDDYQDATFSEEALVLRAAGESLVVAGDVASHVFSFQGTTDVPLRAFTARVPTATAVELVTPHRTGGEAVIEAAFASHTSDEHAWIARELRRVHVQDGVSWRDLAVVVRRQGAHVGGLVAALDDAGIPRVPPEAGVAAAVEAAALPYLLAFRWLADPGGRDGLVESVLTSDLAGLSPASARGLVRAARGARLPAAAAIEREDGLSAEEAESVRTLRRVLAEADAVAGRSALDAFRVLWRALPWSLRLAEEADRSRDGARDLAAVLSFSDTVARAAEGTDRSVGAFLDLLDAGERGPGLSGAPEDHDLDAVRVVTAHGAAGLEFDTVVVAGVIEGNFPSLSRPEPMFDLDVLGGGLRQADRNRLRLQDERRLFDVVLGRARRRVVLTASDPHGEETDLSARSRFAAERGVPWRPAGRPSPAEPLSPADAAAVWRRSLADRDAPTWERLASLDALAALGADPSTWWFQRDWTPATGPLHETIRTSYSKLSTLENCELQYVLAEELGLEDRAGYQAWVGHLVHRLIEDAEDGAVERSLDAMLAAVAERWRPQEFPSFAVSEAFRRLVVEKMLPDWFEVYGGAPAEATELRFSFEFDGATVTGYIDRVGRVEGGGSQITDYKTGSSSKVNLRSPQDNLQLGIYYLAVERAEELAAYRPVRAVELAFLKETAKTFQTSPGPIAIAQLPLTPSTRGDYERAMTERLSGLVGTVRELLETGSYRPNAAADCWFCRFKTLCPLFPEGAELFPVVDVRR